MMVTDMNGLARLKLSPSPRHKMNIFHGQRSIDIDNGTKTGINATKLNIKCGQNLVRIKHNQRQDKNISIMRENN